MPEDLDKISDKLYQLETRVTAIERAQAVAAVEFAQIKEGISDIKGGITWVTRLIIGALAVALLGWVIGGGIASAAIAVI